MDVIERIKRSFGTVSQLFQYAWREKNWFMFPALLLLVIFGLLVLFGQSSPFAPFIYTLF